MTTTTDLSKFISADRDDLIQILQAWNRYGLPTDFEEDEVIPMMNINSGNVFLTNMQGQVAMLNGDKLESFYSCTQCGYEGFLEDMEHSNEKECKQYLKDIKKALKASKAIKY